LDFYLIGILILDSGPLSLLGTLLLGSLFLVLWVFLPRVRRLQRVVGGSE